MADERPEVDGRDPADAVAQMVADVLRLARRGSRGTDARSLPRTVSTRRTRRSAGWPTT
jgi:hypothetical protein